MPISPDGTHFDLTGPEGAPVVTMVHGLGLSLRTFQDHVPPLAKQFRVLSYDICGHGQSALPGKLVSLSVLSDQLCALLDHIGAARTAIVGFSLGGMINRRFAMDHPDRVWALVVLNSPHERTPEAQARVEFEAQSAGSGGPEATIDAALARWFTDDFARSSPDKVADVRAQVLANDPDNYAVHRYVLAAGVKELIRPIPPITTPTLVMTGEFDTGSTPQMAQEIAGEIDGASCQIVPGLKHLGLIENPTAFGEPMKDFLAEHAPKQD